MFRPRFPLGEWTVRPARGEDGEGLKERLESRRPRARARLPFKQWRWPVAWPVPISIFMKSFVAAASLEAKHSEVGGPGRQFGERWTLTAALHRWIARPALLLAGSCPFAGPALAPIFDTPPRLLADGLLRYYHRLRTISDGDSFSSGWCASPGLLNVSRLNKQIAAGWAALTVWEKTSSPAVDTNRSNVIGLYRSCIVDHLKAVFDNLITSR